MTRKEEIEKGLKYFEQNKDRMVSLYKEMYGDTICLNCPNSIPYAYNKMFRDRNKQTSNYRMERGVIIDTTMREEEGIIKGQFSFHNITDEIAENLIIFGYGSKFI